MTKKKWALYNTFFAVGLLALLWATIAKFTADKSALPDYMQLLGLTLISIWMPKIVRKLPIISTTILLIVAAVFFILGLCLTSLCSFSDVTNWIVLNIWAVLTLFLFAYADWSDENKKQ